MGDKFWWINSKLYLVGRKYGQSIVNLKQEIFEIVIFCTTLLVLFPNFLSLNETTRCPRKNVLLINGHPVPIHVWMKPKKLDKERTRSMVFPQPIRLRYIYSALILFWYWNYNCVQQISTLHSHWFGQKFLNCQALS